MDNDEAIIMQYTGLKDKNGTEIFEGDIVCARFKPTYGGWAVDQGVISWWDSNACFGLNFNGKRHDIAVVAYIHSAEDFEFEVLGNIYENQGLVKP